MNIILRRKRLGRTSTRELCKHTQNLTPIRNDLLYKKKKEPVQWLFRWGCTSICNAEHTVNKATAISLANNKTQTRRLLSEYQKTLKKNIIPKTWYDVEDNTITYPCIIRAEHHAQGRELYLCNNKEELVQYTYLPNYYITEYISKEKEYRVFVAQNRVVWVTEKTPGNPNDIAWNVAKGGRFDNVRWNDWPLRACRIALQTIEAVDLDFGGVDIIKDNNNYYVLEVNTAPSQTSPYRQECTGKAFQNIINTSNILYPTPNKINLYRDCIHPSLL